MSEALQYLSFAILVAIALISVFSLMENSYIKYRHIYINNVEDLTTHYYRYVLYFLGVGIFAPFSELYIELFSVRKESELFYNILVGLFCFGLAFLSRYSSFIRDNLHRFFAGFFVVYNSLIVYKIATTEQMEYLTLAEFTFVNMISYYVFYNFKYFYVYLFSIVAALLMLDIRGIISTRDFIIYFNSSFIAFIINYVIHYIDLSIKENLFFAYNFVNKGNLLIIGVNREGVVTFVSKNIEEKLGYNTNELIGKTWATEVVNLIGVEEKDDSKIKRIKVKNGAYKFLDWHEEVFNNDLNLKIGRDITEIKNTETQLTISNGRLNNLLSNIGDLVFVLNLDYVFTEYYQNESNEDLFLKPANFLGKKFDEIGFPADAFEAIKNAIYQTVHTNKKSSVEYSLNTIGGKQWFNVVISPLADEEGKLSEIICIARNITERKRAEIELKRTKEGLEQTSYIAQVGGWELNLQTSELYWSDSTKAIHEVPLDYTPSVEKAIMFYREDDGSRGIIKECVERVINEGGSYDVELPIITAKGNEIWVKTIGHAEFEHGVCKRIYGAIQDITKQVKAKNALIQSEEKFRYISENISDVVIVFENNKVSYISPSHEKQFGYTIEEAISIAERNIYDFVHPDDHDFLKNLYQDAIQNQVSNLNYVIRFLHRNGTYIWREESVTLIYDAKGNLSMRLITAKDVSERRNAEIRNQLRQERVLLQNQILVRLSKTPLVEEGDFWNDGLQKIVEAAVEGTDVERVSMWRFDENQLSCIDLYIQSRHISTNTNVLYEKDFPKYFEAIKNQVAIVAEDAHTNKYTNELTEAYLKPHDIQSLLDLPIYAGGELIGVICWEQMYQSRQWSDEDITFARAIVDVISLSVEADKRFKAEKELKRTKELLEQTSIIAKVGGWEIDVETQSIFFSDINKVTLEAPTSFNIDIAESLKFFKEGESRSKISEAINLCFKKGISFDIEVQIITLKGNERWVRAMGQAEYQNGRCRRLYGTFQDIDEQVKLVQIITNKELQYRTLISNISSVTFRCLNDDSWTMIFISDAIEQLTGYPADDFILNNKRCYADLVHPDDRDFVNVHSNETNREYTIEYRILNKNNEVVWVNEKGRSYYDEIEKRILLDGIISNITERKHAEIALVKSYEELQQTQTQLLAIQVEQEKFVNLVKYSGAFIGMSDLKGNLIFLNEKAKQISGLGENFENVNVQRLHTEAGGHWLKEVILPEVVKNGVWHGEHDLINAKTKEVRYTDATTFLVRDPIMKKAIAFASIQIDITERKEAEAKLRENQRQLESRSQILAAIAKMTEKLLVSQNIEETLNETFYLIGESTNVDRVFFFENDLAHNRITQKVEWVRAGISSQLNNPETHDLPFSDLKTYADVLLQNKAFHKRLSQLDNPEIIRRWHVQNIKSILLLPVFIKDKFHGFIGFDDCTQERIWSEDKINILISLSTNIANAIERINNEAIIRESEGNFRQLNETLEDVFLLFDVVKQRYIYVSPSCKEVLGPPQSYFYEGGRFVDDYLIEEDKNINAIIGEQITNSNASEVEYRIKAADGGVKWIYQKSFGIRNERGELIRISGICTDITEQKLIQGQLKELSLVAEKITNGVIIVDNKGDTIWANQSFLEMMEIKADKLFGRNPIELFKPKVADSIDGKELLGTNFNIESEVETFKNNKKWVEIINTVIKDDEGKIVQEIGVVIDISQRKEAENLLKESEEKFRFIAENTSDGIFVIENGEIIYTSPSFQKMFGYTFEESAEYSKGDLMNFVHPDDIKVLTNSMQHAIRNKVETFNMEYRTLHKDGHYVWREDTMTAIYQGDNVYRFISVVRDITERKKAEERLRESERKLSSVLNALDEVVWAISVPDYKLLLVSNSFEKVYGYSAREWRLNFNLWKEAIFEEDREIGEKIEIDVLSTGVGYGIYRIRDAFGGLKWLENATKMIKNEADEPLMIMGITTDITEKKLAEEALRKAQESAEEANRARAELELRALQMQMNPHFIFNALNSIQSYVMSQDTLTANLYLSKFSTLIRLFLDSSRSKFIPLAEEIRLLTLYIELEKIRFENKFDFEINVEPDVSRYIEIPTMILQPFIENAINHGLNYKATKGLLSVKFYKDKGYLICKVEDNGVGRKNAAKIQAKSSKGYKSQGMKITTERLITYNKINNANIVFSINDKIESPANSNDEVGTVIEIRFPYN
ncbi:MULTISPECIES: PAS domain S-box protein [Emticicia]|uniref:PAS domain S-box protein n=1 Tax=Emticicia TaxID=312278 RepID=UPI0007D8C078|nr:MULTISPECIES: PAS domain S-box protein [Emticicia]